MSLLVRLFIETGSGLEIVGPVQATTATEAEQIGRDMFSRGSHGRRVVEIERNGKAVARLVSGVAGGVMLEKISQTSRGQMPEHLRRAGRDQSGQGPSADRSDPAESLPI